MLRGTWFVIISLVLADQARGPHYCIRNAQAAIGHPHSGHFTTSRHLPDLLMTTDKDKRKAIYDSAILAAGWTQCIFPSGGNMSRDTGTIMSPTTIHVCLQTTKNKQCVCASATQNTSRPWPISHISVKKTDIYWRGSAKISRNSIIRLFKKFTIPSSGWFETVSLTVCPSTQHFSKWMKNCVNDQVH